MITHDDRKLALFLTLVVIACLALLCLLPPSGLESGHASTYKATVTYGPITHPAPTAPPTRTLFSMGDLSAIQDAAAYAAWCGGSLEVWSDGDLTVIDCDK